MEMNNNPGRLNRTAQSSLCFVRSPLLPGADHQVGRGVVKFCVKLAGKGRAGSRLNLSGSDSLPGGVQMGPSVVGSVIFKKAVASRDLLEQRKSPLHLYASTLRWFLPSTRASLKRQRP